MRFSPVFLKSFLAGTFMLLGVAFLVPSHAFAAAPVYTVDLLIPTVGDVLRADALTEITWKQGEGDASLVNLYYSEDAGVTWKVIVEHTVNDGSYHWTVAHIQSQAVLVKIATTDLVETLATDVSDAFTVSFYEEDNAPYWENGAAPLLTVPSDVDGIMAGDFVRTEDTNLSYIDADMVRHPLFDEQTYFTYEDTSEKIIDVSENTIHKFALGAPLSPQAGTVLVKTPSVAKVYMTEQENDGSLALRWITSENIAEQMFGTDWNAYVLDIDPTLFTRYAMGNAITEAYTVDLSFMKRVDALHE